MIMKYYLRRHIKNSCFVFYHRFQKAPRGYYTVARRYELYVRLAETIISRVSRLQMSEISFLPREHKIHIFEPTCNFRIIIWRQDVVAYNKRHEQPRSFCRKSAKRDVNERYDTRQPVIRKIRHSGPGWSGVWILRVV